jgi:hypothetical protein
MQDLLLGRVTRLGEFQPNGRSPFWGRFIKITKVAQYFGLLFLQSKDYVHITFDKECVRLKFWRFFHNLIKDRCYDFLNIFAENFSKKFAFLTLYALYAKF